MVKIEYICLGNIVRSQTYEAVTRHHANLQGVGIDVVSSGLGLKRWRLGDYTHDEVKFLLFETARLENELPKAPAYQELFRLIRLGLPHAGEMNDTVRDLAIHARTTFEAFNFRYMLQALSAHGIDHIGHPKPTVFQPDIDLVVCTADSMLDDAAKIYPKKRIVSVTQFGKEPVGYSPKLEDHIKNVELAKQQVPRIVEYAINNPNR